MEFETEPLYANDKHVIAKMYKFLLSFEIEEQVKECMIKWARNLGYNIQYTDGSMGKNV